MSVEYVILAFIMTWINVITETNACNRSKYFYDRKRIRKTIILSNELWNSYSFQLSLPVIFMRLFCLFICVWERASVTIYPNTYCYSEFYPEGNCRQKTFFMMYAQYHRINIYWKIETREFIVLVRVLKGPKYWWIF